MLNCLATSRAAAAAWASNPSKPTRRPAMMARITSGCACICAGVPSASTLPKSSATTRSEVRMTKLRWCSTMTMETAKRSRISLVSSPSCSTSSWLRPPAGSSRSSSFGPLASERASSTRFFTAKGSSATVVSARDDRPSCSRRASAFARDSFSARRTAGRRNASARKPAAGRAARPTCVPVSTLSRTVIVSKSATCWKVRAMPIRGMA